MIAHSASKGPRPTRHPTPFLSRPIIALLTDFGLKDHYVGTVKGVIVSIAPETRIVDITHNIAPQDISSGAYALWASYRFFPSNTIFVSLVDPGVGGERGVKLIWNRKYTFVAPDNGILDLILAQEDHLAAIDVDTKNSALTLGNASSTFHGRDIFAPLAAYLSRGINPASLGNKVRIRRPDDPFVSSTSQRQGIILHQDHFGNCITNIRNGLMDHIGCLIVRGKRISGVVRYYAEAPEKMVCLIKGSSGLVEICVKNGSAAQDLGVTGNQLLDIEWK